MDSRDKFSDRAADYTIGRPSYAQSFIDYLYSDLGFSAEICVADIGCGTGKLTRQLLEKGSRVFAVEPNDDMRGIAQSELNNYDKLTVIKGDSSHTNLKDNSVDFVVAAQAFHWFDTDEFREECKRIQKQGAKVILVWNMRDEEDDVNKAVYDMNKKYCPSFKGFTAGLKKDDEKIAQFFYDKYELIVFDNPLYYNREKFISRCLSSSYSLKSGDEKYNEFIKCANDIFDKYSSNDGTLKVCNQTFAYIGSV